MLSNVGKQVVQGALAVRLCMRSIELLKALIAIKLVVSVHGLGYAIGIEQKTVIGSQYQMVRGVGDSAQRSSAGPERAVIDSMLPLARLMIGGLWPALANVSSPVPTW